MERRFQVRLDELLLDAEVHAGLLRGVVPRLETFLEPFVKALRTVEQKTNVTHYVSGLMSDLHSKDVESIAYLHDRDRQGLQKFIGQSEWDHRPPLDELARQVASALGEPDGVLVFDPSAFPKQGTESVGVQRQWCGRLGKVENCQVGIYLGYVSRRDHALVDMRLYLPKIWANRKQPPQEGRRAGRDSLPHPARADAGDARRAAVRCCRTPGSPAMTRWAVARGFVRSCGRGASVTCWRCRRIRWCGT